MKLQRKLNSLLVNFAVLYYTSRVTPVYTCVHLCKIPDFEIHWVLRTGPCGTWLHRLCTAQLKGGGAGHIGYDEKCIPSVQGTPVKPSERLQYFPDEHALPFNKYLMSIYCTMYETLF